jgi:hypothetical protein
VTRCGIHTNRIQGRNVTQHKINTSKDNTNFPAKQKLITNKYIYLHWFILTQEMNKYAHKAHNRID